MSNTPLSEAFWHARGYKEQEKAETFQGRREIEIEGMKRKLKKALGCSKLIVLAEFEPQTIVTHKIPINHLKPYIQEDFTWYQYVE